MGVCTDTRSHGNVSAFRLTDAYVYHSAHFITFTVQGRIEKAFHQVTSATVASSTSAACPLHLRCICATGSTMLHQTKTGLAHQENVADWCKWFEHFLDRQLFGVVTTSKPKCAKVQTGGVHRYTDLGLCDETRTDERS